MSPAVLDGRIVKSSKGKIGSTALVKRRKHNWRDLLAKFTEEIKYFYFHCGYTREEVNGAMEKLFQIGASPQDYRYFLNQPDFKKNLTEDDWNLLAPYYFASTALNFKVAIKKHNGYIVEPGAVEKGVSRFPRPKAITQDLTTIKPGEPYTFGSLTAYNPDEVVLCPPIPKTIIIPNNLLSGSELDRLLDHTSTALSPEKQLSSPWMEEEEEIFQTADQETTTENIEILGLRQPLKALLSTDTISIKAFAENLLPLLILRRDEDMILHIFQTHGAKSMEVKWYTGLLEIDLKKRLGYFFKTDGDADYFDRKYGPHSVGADYLKDVRQFLIKGITTYLPEALTSQEAAALVAYTLDDGDITLDLMQLLFPITCTRSKIEEQYEILYGSSILDSQSRFTLKDLVSFGFRRNIHILALEAIVENNFEKASVLLPHTELALSSMQLQDLDLGVFSLSYGNVWDIVGKSQLRELLHRVEEEARDPNCRRNFFRVQDILSISFQLRNYELMEFTLDLVRTHPQLDGRGIVSILMESVHTMDLPESSLRIAGILNQKSDHEDDDGEVEKTRLLHDLLQSEIQKRRENDGIPHISREAQLHSAIWARDSSLLRYLIRIGAKVNEKNSLGEAPIITAMIKERDDGPDRTAMELRDEIDIFVQLLEAKAEIDCLTSFRLEMDPDGYLFRVDPNFIEAANDIDKARIGKLWSTRFERVPDYDDDGTNSGLKSKETEPWASRTTKLSPLLSTFGQTVYEDTLPIQLEKPAGDGEREVFLRYRDRIFETMRKSFLRDRGGYHRQLFAGEIQLFLQESKNWGHEDIFIINNAFFHSPITFLQYLAAFGSIRLLQLFFQLHPQEATAQLSQSYPDSPSPLQLASARNHLDCVIFLISNGSDPREPVCLFFWRMGAYTKMKTKHLGGGITPLHYAVFNGNLEMAMCLLERGASIHACKQSATQQSRDMTRKRRRFDKEDGAVSVLELAVILGRRDCVALFLISDKDARHQALKMARALRQNHIASLIIDTWGEELPRAQKSKVERPAKRHWCSIDADDGQPRAILPKAYN
ncbi:hypothetical protein TWF506_008222 [Arthrobotrys conoides]|uniref:Ankyrin repeat protein n=1 Tax=Arthrobotrys conoides TaxID=74498 RepID=A0AAN8RX82_9PEZI